MSQVEYRFPEEGEVDQNESEPPSASFPLPPPPPPLPFSEPFYENHTKPITLGEDKTISSRPRAKAYQPSAPPLVEVKLNNPQADLGL